MRRLHLTLLLIFLPVHACRSSTGTARDPGSPTPVVDRPAPGAEAPPQADPSAGPAIAGGEERRVVPLRPDQAPLVRIQEALEADSLLGRRVRVSGRCTAAGAGRRAGSWTLEDGGSTIEVRGLVPSSCGASSALDLTIFAQIEPTTTGSRDRLLLRLPD